MNKKRSLEELKALKKDSPLSRGELALLSGIKESTIKHYTEIGLLPFEQSEDKKHRRYIKGIAVKRLQEIRKKIISLSEIKESLE